ncbi:MAG: phosphoenolpyruvate synthase [Bacteroidales bacterium]|nr:phosphoenolpyruvate synthase [Bacteroidales bacterium]
MNAFEPVSLRELKKTDYVSLIKYRIRKILMICSNYDAFILEEDGQIESQIYREYIDLNLSNAPKFIWTPDSNRAREIISENDDIDLVICMYNHGDREVFNFAGWLKRLGRNIPFVLLTHFSKEIYRCISLQDTTNVDYIFSWHGNAELIVAIIKLFEDRENADNDILNVGVQAILLVEDSVRYYSTYLPELYKLVLKQSAEFLKDTFSEQQRKLRKRSRPKILLATNYGDAIELYEKYKSNLLGVISDVGFVLHKNDSPEMEKRDAGLDLVRTIKADDPLMPVLLQSSQASLADVAHRLGAGFLKKYSKTLMLQLTDYIREEFGFGDFVFRDRNRVEYGRAADLKELEKIIKVIPDDVLLYNTSRNMLSKWLYSRGLFTLAGQFRAVRESSFASMKEHREYIAQMIHDYHVLTGRGIIARFEASSYEKYIWFARMGEGSLGGKARGLGFLNSLIQKYQLANKYPDVRISIPRTVVVATDYFDRFIIENDLQYVIDSEVSDEEILSEFVASRLPKELMDDLKAFLETVSSPLAVRSSSKLEDSNYQPFAGVYSTYMVPLTENRDQMLRLLGKAIKSVYASVFFTGSRAYIHTTGNLLSEEKMAVVIQSICGTGHDGLYYPMLSGVARSVNFYPIGNEKAQDGIVNLAFGLGKTVVDGGNSLRFSPKFPKKILQLSEPKLALRDTQKKMYALDLRPGAFKISKNDSVNLVHIPVSEVLDKYGYPEIVASTYSVADSRIVPGIYEEGPRIVTFDAILKYGRFPLAKIIAELMEICKRELMCDIEMEFAADMVHDSDGKECVLKLLQIRPISEFVEDSGSSLEKMQEQIGTTFVHSSMALGNGRINGLRHIVYVPSAGFDSACTKQIAGELAEINTRMKAEGKQYMLVGPGRWGSSDPWLGIPVLWSDISEAKLIVECAIPGYRIEPSQGTHFFQNITSLGVGYLTVDAVLHPEDLNEDALSSLPAIEQTDFVKVLELPDELVAFIDRNTSNAVVGLASETVK